jgi:hypothetical protein
MQTAEQIRFQTEFRPLVSEAWIRHCKTSGIPQNRSASHEAWYRDLLWSTCRLRSTKDATVADRSALIDLFRLLANDASTMPPDLPTIQGLTPSQERAFSRLAEAAWEASCERAADPVHCGPWVSNQLHICCDYDASGWRANKIEGFDRLMAHFAVIAGDEYWLDRTAAAAEIRMRYVILQLVSDLTELTGRLVDWSYCRSIYEHMGLPLTMDEAPARLLWKVLQALDTHVRRLRARSEITDPVPF